MRPARALAAGRPAGRTRGLIPLPLSRSLRQAHADVIRELELHGFWTDRLRTTEVIPTLFSSDAYGYQQYKSSGHIEIPVFSVPDLRDRLLGQPRYSPHDLLRHEYGHAVAHHHPGLIRSKRFTSVFWASHDSADDGGWEFEEGLFVSPYAASHPSEDFAETFMLYLRYMGILPAWHDTPPIRAKWRFIRDLGRALARGRSRWWGARPPSARRT